MFCHPKVTNTDHSQQALLDLGDLVHPKTLVTCFQALESPHCVLVYIKLNLNIHVHGLHSILVRIKLKMDIFNFLSESKPHRVDWNIFWSEI